MKGFFSRAVLAGTTIIGVVAFASAAQASDSVFQTFTGNDGVSTSGWGSTSQSGTISTTSIAAGSTVVAAYLYSSTFDSVTPGGTFGGSAVNYSTALGQNPSACCGLEAYRADVTSVVAAAVNGGAGGVYNFGITETSSGQDGEALVVVYSNAAQSTQTIAILNGFASSTGDNSTISFGAPLDPSAPGFFAHMIIGDGFSCCSQESTIAVDGQLMTTVAGNNDNSVDGATPQNGDLITVGNINGPYTGGTPGSPQTDYNADHEAYDLSSFITAGDTTIGISTTNPSLDDNIFLTVFDVSGVASVSNGAVPEPATWAMFLLGFGAIGWTLRSRRNRSAMSTTA